MTSLPLYGAIALQFIDTVVELAFIVNFVGWNHSRAGKEFFVSYQGSEFSLNGKPLNYLVDQGHTANGAAGTSIVVIGVGGALALYLRRRQLKHNNELRGFTKFLYNFWLYMTAITAVFTIAAFVYLFVVTYQHAGQHIDLGIASQLNNQPYPGNVPYPKDTWTPQNWFPAMLELNLVSAHDRSDIKFHVALIKGWQWNLIPMVILSIITAVLAFIDKKRHDQGINRSNGASRLEAARKKSGSLYS